MIMGGIQIPVFGCWKITGHYKDQELSFVVWVTPHTEQKSLLGGSTDCGKGGCSTMLKVESIA
jgi:hypothetical protein